MAEHVIFSGTIVCTQVDKKNGIAHFVPMAHQMQNQWKKYQIFLVAC